jgi:hypothetical protein
MITLHDFIAEGFKLDKGGDRIRAVVEARDFLVIVTDYAIYRVHEAHDEKVNFWVEMVTPL